MSSSATARGFLKAAKAEYAPGIPEKTRFSELPTLEAGGKWRFVLHAHKADRAGPHMDLRLGNPETGVAHSWAFRGKGLPAPGQRQLVIQQPDHTLPYMKFHGRIEKGYGKGDVSIAEAGQATVLDSTPSKMHFRAGGRRYVLVSTPKYRSRSWLLIGLRGPKKKA